METVTRIEALDHRTFGSVGRLTVGRRTLDFPARVHRLSSTATSEHRFANLTTSTKNQALCLSRSIDWWTLRDLSQSRERFFRFKERIEQSLSPVPIDVVRFVNAQPHRATTVTDQTQTLTRLSHTQILALYDLLDAKGNDVLVLPVPAASSIETVSQILELFQRQAHLFKSERPIMGFIPARQSHEYQRNLLELYLRSGVRLFGLDFGQAFDIESAINVSSYLRLAGRRLGEEHYFLHAFNVPHVRSYRSPLSPISDLLCVMMGLDSFSNIHGMGGRRSRLRTGVGVGSRVGGPSPGTPVQVNDGGTEPTLLRKYDSFQHYATLDLRQQSRGRNWPTSSQMTLDGAELIEVDKVLDLMRSGKTRETDSVLRRVRVSGSVRELIAQARAISRRELREYINGKDRAKEYARGIESSLARVTGRRQLENFI